MDSLLDANLLMQLKANTIVKGRISEIRSNEVAIDIGAKAEGIVPASEFLNFDELSVGEEVEVYVERVENAEGRPVLSYDKAQQQKNWERQQRRLEPVQSRRSRHRRFAIRLQVKNVSLRKLKKISEM